VLQQQSGSSEAAHVVRVGTRTPPQKLAGALAYMMRRGEDVCMSAVGAYAVNAAVEAVALLRTFCESEPWDVGFVVAEERRTIEDGAEGHLDNVVTFSLVRLPRA
jgi:stage V sporulation protein SpoVS